MRSRAEFYASFSAYTKSFGTFDNAYPLLRVKAFMPPRGLLLCRFCPPPSTHAKVGRRPPICHPDRSSRKRDGCPRFATAYLG